MNKVTIEINDKYKYCPAIFADGKLLKLKKNKNKNVWSATVDVDKQEFELCVNKYYTIQSKFWFLEWFLYWIVGAFGIFSPRFEKKFLGLNYVATINLNNEAENKPQNKENQNFVSISLNAVLPDKKALEITSTHQVNEEENCNKYFSQPQLTKRAKLAKRIGFAALLIIAIVLVFVL